MNPTLDVCLRSWPWEPWLVGGLVLTTAIYFRGWRGLHRRDPARWTIGRFAAFFGGTFAIFLALASPIEPFSFFFLQVHMLQHLLLMMVAPPLLWLGAPLFPMLRGMPRDIRAVWIAPLLRSAFLKRAFGRLTHPLSAWVLYVGVTWIWHVPRLYDLALRSDGWHWLQHACFLGASLIFWYPVVRPYPSRPSWSLWWLVPLLILADVQNTVLSALLTFSSRVIYPYYDEVPRLGNVSALDDQATAGVLMWVPGSVAFLLPLFWIGLKLMFGSSASSAVRLLVPRGTLSPQGPAAGLLAPPRRIALPLVSEPAGDLLRAPLLGRFLRWRHARACMQISLVVLAGLVVVDGFRGPQTSPTNLAGVLPWIHWRGLLIFGLLVLGNVFCMACPFMLPRTLARRVWSPMSSWPRGLRNKWLAASLLVLFFWAYEAFSLWDSPWITAWIIVGYFAAALVVDSLFRGASFCKYVCPIGQFNFVQSLVSPLEVKVRDRATCAACATKDCIRGNGDVPGCELRLYQPRKASNMDCTFCLDCVHACPHDNIAIALTPPGRELFRDSQRSGLGRLSRRRDLAALILILVFAGFANAALMTGPLVELQDRIAESTGSLVATTLAFLTLLSIPIALVFAAAIASRRLGRTATSWVDVAVRYAYAFVPLGFGVWLAHYSFHFLTSYATVVPAGQRFFADHGWPIFGAPDWGAACCMPPATWLLRLEIVMLEVGVLLSLYVAYRIAATHSSRTLAALAPWVGLLLLLFAVGTWILFQPMQMRGTLPG